MGHFPDLIILVFAMGRNKIDAVEVYVIIPVHNRKAITLKCLDHLQGLRILAKYKIIVVDDGSQDGTATAIQAFYPEVIILSGDGNLWWTGAIKLGMEYAYHHGADYFIWLNDDTLPLPGAIEGIINACQLESSPSIVSAQCYADTELTLPSYGAHKKVGGNLIAAYTTTDEIIVGDAVSGNLVCLPRSVVEDIAYPPAEQYPHYYGDLIYTWKAKQGGYKIQCYGAYKAICRPHQQQCWLLGEDSIYSIWQSFFSPKSYFYFKSHWYWCITLYGWLSIFVFIRPYLQLLRAGILRWLFPRSFLIYLKGAGKTAFHG
jgi:GT2 family glycosyltransferase